ncbi:hypothetical protein [Modicisalibacter luteus]|uniref:Uncharacterized protein n=1 Tax=Modicisalibacter luteus TaxID=453962 RepID=A0ABV7LW51_9GAMM|nr:hypothetical protein [Halomonas lutea]GHB11452.1 hypothetical protein GCM10007159_37020 [Halomonas lutea]
MVVVDLPRTQSQLCQHAIPAGIREDSLLRCWNKAALVLLGHLYLKILSAGKISFSLTLKRIDDERRDLLGTLTNESSSRPSVESRVSAH